MIHLVLTLAFVLNAQPSVKDYGAIGDGIADDSAAFARALKSLDGLGGALRIPKGVYNLGTTGIRIPKTFGGIRLIGDSATASKLLYRGSDAAIQIGVPDALTYGHTLSDIHIDISHAGPEAVGIRIYPSLYIALVRLYVTSNNQFTPKLNRQMGIVAIGGTSAEKLFGAYLRIEDPRINGRFVKGIYLTGPEIGWGFNSSILEGGAVVYAGEPQPGTVGIHIEQGNQNVLTLVDVEQFETGILSDAYANLFVGSRTEGNRVGLVLSAATQQFTGGAFNKVVSGFHEDGLINRSHGSELVATMHPGFTASALSVRRPADTLPESATR